jgi:hypothetical protein
MLAYPLYLVAPMEGVSRRIFFYLTHFFLSDSLHLE